MEQAQSGVTRQLSLDLIDASGASTTVQAELAYDAADPFAVTAVFRTGEAPVRWVFGRELLAEGMFSPAGDGDVHVWPCLDARGSAVVILELCSPHGEALMQAPSRDVCEFLHGAFTLVPPGSEDMQFDVDAAIEAMLPPQE